ncbi:methyltransferase [Basidiobolus meristosporus CBS 931.73]|uniref:Methyltransferase n=1 Tax=Basidiobolus meristosporus CBS 931.73 TaxID=1314790 RepID=A0A1Y1X5H5_9FUNG|nr:methyltransferase [Basidiobolus meristosporus CBS 931.73]|eukprot:ORX81067.1 methyltransferase [Basidiobolus meristosporus CBS 931.73]
MTSQSWSPSNYATHANFVPNLTVDVVKLLQPSSEWSILDLGCGDGVLTKKLEGICNKVVGVDSSPEMIEAAKQLGCQDARVVDGHELDPAQFEEKFDAVFSNAALHWMKKDPAAVIRGVRDVLKPNGRFVGEMGGHLNCHELHSALIHAVNKRGQNGVELSPWFFPTVEEYAELLEANGFKVEHIELVPRITPLPTDVGGWVRTFGGSFFKPFDRETQEEMIQEVMDFLKPVCYRQNQWSVMYVRLRFVAFRV